MAQSQSESFELLHPKIQRWIWERRWTELRDAQERSIPLILGGETDLIIAAATASGKTEAAFLPIASRLLQQGGRGLALYVSPLKALINDQWARMDDLFGVCELPVHPWHRDITASRKSRFERDPQGALLITPESLESIFVRRGFYVGDSFKDLSVVVIDELHAFINTERGMQLASLLTRLEVAVGRRIQRVGLSATLGDMQLAAEFLRPGAASGVSIIESKASGQELRLLIKGYTKPGRFFGKEGNDDDESDQRMASVAVARDVYKATLGTKSLVFANSRARVEEITHRLNRLCEQDRRPSEFFPHHGSLSKSLREDAEDRLKESGISATAICTSTLEMGIDIGQVQGVCQIDAPFSVASLRQRLGRSGRRGEPSVLRIFVTEGTLDSHTAPPDALRLDLVQSIAVVNLLLKGWCEPPHRARLHLSTLIQQVLSLVAERGGVMAKDAWRITCKLGPFRNVDPSAFSILLRGLAAQDILMQSTDGTLLHAPVGERIVNHYSFYAAFNSPEEFRVVNGTTTLGNLPVEFPIVKDSLILFGGRRWRVLDVDDRKKVIMVAPAPGGKAPIFDGHGGDVHREVHLEMKRLYESSEVPRFLDATARTLLEEGREKYSELLLTQRNLIGYDDASLLFLWGGSLITNTVLVQLESLGFRSSSFGVGLWVQDVEPTLLRKVLRTMVEDGPQDPEVVADSVLHRDIDKYDCFLPQPLLSLNYASCRLDVEGAWNILREHLT